MAASAYADTRFYPHYGRLNGNSQYRAWCPGNARDRTQYLQVDMGAVYFVCAVATQGDRMHDERTTSYKFHFSLDGKIWETYKENSAAKVRKLKCLSVIGHPQGMTSDRGCTEYMSNIIKVTFYVTFDNLVYTFAQNRSQNYLVSVKKQQR